MRNIELNKVNKETGEVIGTMNLEIKAFPIAEPKGNTRGYASVSIDGLFGLHGISIVNGQNGLFMAMPQSKDSRGKYHDIFHPTTSEGRKELQDAVISEFGIALEEMAAQKESTVQKLRETANAAKEKTAPAPLPAKAKTDKNKGGAEL